jgi:hypothetical protein
MTLYVSVELSESDTVDLVNMARSCIKDTKYASISYEGLKKSHITLCYHSDFKQAHAGPFKEFIKKYTEGLSISFNLNSLVVDEHAAAFRVSLIDEVPYYPEDKNLHITILLKDRKPVYSNELIKKSMGPGPDGPQDCLIVPVDIVMKGSIKMN